MKITKDRLENIKNWLMKDLKDFKWQWSSYDGVKTTKEVISNYEGLTYLINYLKDVQAELNIIEKDFEESLKTE